MENLGKRKTTSPRMLCVFNMASPIAVWLLSANWRRCFSWVGLCLWRKFEHFRQEDESVALDIKTTPQTSRFHQSRSPCELRPQKRPVASARGGSGRGVKPGAGAECRRAGGGAGGLHHRGGGGSSSERAGARPGEETLRIWPLGRRESRFSHLV